jgi:TRAP transporter 4TM/12TM fusion protein
MAGSLRALWSEGKLRELSPAWKRALGIFALVFALFQVWAAPFGFIEGLIHRSVFLGFVLALTFVCYTAWGKSHTGRVPVVDVVLGALGFAAGLYVWWHRERFTTRWEGVDPLTTLDLFFAVVMVLLVLEVTRRTVGPVLTLIILTFVAYCFVGKYIPGELGHRGMTPIRFLERMVYTMDGIPGTPLGVAATYVYMFVLFGVVLNASGAGVFFFRMATAVAGHLVGGPAKISVIASAFYGTMSGSPTANVVTTGSFTIPLMKRVGYTPSFAGAVEAAASTGGSLLPPIMGTAAFLMVDVAGIPYIKIALAAIIPALLYYFGLMMQVHYRAVGLGIATIQGERENPWVVLRENFHHLIPLAVMVWLIVIGQNPTLVGLIATLVTIFISWLKPGNRMGPKQIMKALEHTAVSTITVANASAAAGMVIGGIMLTGLGGKFTGLLFQLTGSDPLLTLVMVALVCILLGMGMPIPAAYLLTATLAAPSLLGLGFSMMSAHLFIVYFSTMSALTPPVAVAAYAGAGIAMSNPNATGFQATRLAIAAYLVPFVFMYRPGLLLEGSIVGIVWSVFVGVVAVWGLAGGLEGRLLEPISSRVHRAALVVFSVLLLWPGLWADLLGFTVVGGTVVLQVLARRTRGLKAAVTAPGDGA